MCYVSLFEQIQVLKYLYRIYCFLLNFLNRLRWFHFRHYQMYYCFVSNMSLSCIEHYTPSSTWKPNRLLFFRTVILYRDLAWLYDVSSVVKFGICDKLFNFCNIMKFIFCDMKILRFWDITKLSICNIIKFIFCDIMILTFSLKPHTNDIWTTYKYIRVTYARHTSNIQMTCERHTRTHGWHTNDIQNGVRMTWEWHKKY